MSWVTNIILCFNCIEYEENRIKDINDFDYFKENNYRLLVYVDDSELPFGWYGGSKKLEAQVMIGAFNWFDLDGFIKHIRKIKFISPENVQVFVKKPEDDRFRLINVFDEE